MEKEGKSNREIARLLGKSHQTINNEIKHSAVDLSYTSGGIEYSAQKAQTNHHRLRLAVERSDTWSVEKEAIIREKIK